MTADELAEHLFDVANQFNRGATRLIDRDEKAQVATIDLRAGRKAMASAAYASARAYFSAGMALLDERDWDSRYELTFSLWLEHAECEYLTGNFEKAEQLLVELLQRAASNVEFATASCLKIDLHDVEGRIPASRRQRTHMPAPIRHRPAGTPDLRAGPGRIQVGLADPQWAPDREPDRSAADDRSRTAGCHAGALGSYAPPPTKQTFTYFRYSRAAW